MATIEQLRALPTNPAIRMRQPAAIMETMVTGLRNSLGTGYAVEESDPLYLAFWNIAHELGLDDARGALLLREMFPHTAETDEGLDADVGIFGIIRKSGEDNEDLLRRYIAEIETRRAPGTIGAIKSASILVEPPAGEGRISSMGIVVMRDGGLNLYIVQAGQQGDKTATPRVYPLTPTAAMLTAAQNYYRAAGVTQVEQYAYALKPIELPYTIHATVTYSANDGNAFKASCARSINKYVLDRSLPGFHPSLAGIYGALNVPFATNITITNLTALNAALAIPTDLYAETPTTEAPKWDRIAGNSGSRVFPYYHASIKQNDARRKQKVEPAVRMVCFPDAVETGTLPDTPDPSNDIQLTFVNTI